MKSIKVLASLENLNTVLEFAEQSLEEIGCSMKAAFQINLALEELFVNIVSYAYPEDEKPGFAEIIIDGCESEQRVSIALVDRGIPYDPLQKDDPDVTLSAEERDIGGLGIFLTKKTMDELYYKREDDKNMLTIIKKW